MIFDGAATRLLQLNIIRIRTRCGRAELRQYPGDRVPDSLKQLSGEIPSVSVCSVTARRLIGRAVPRSSDPAAATPRRGVITPGDDRREVDSLSDTAVPANSSQRTRLSPCCADLHILRIGYLKRVRRCLSPIHSCTILSSSIVCLINKTFLSCCRSSIGLSSRSFVICEYFTLLDSIILRLPN